MKSEGGTEAHLFNDQINFRNNEELNYVCRETTEPLEEEKSRSDNEEPEYRAGFDY